MIPIGKDQQNKVVLALRIGSFFCHIRSLRYDLGKMTINTSALKKEEVGSYAYLSKVGGPGQNPVIKRLFICL